MWIMVASIIVMAICVVAVYMIWSSRKSEMRKYYDAAYKMVKEACLDDAIHREDASSGDRQKVMLYLKWKDSKKQGFVFDPAKEIRIGRDPMGNEICIQEDTVSAKHCKLFLYEGSPAIRDLRSANGTWIKRGLWKHPVESAELIFTGDRLMIGSIRIRIIIFTFDMAYV